MKYRLIVITRKWNRNLKGPEPAQWETKLTQHFELPEGKTLIGIKRSATKIIFNRIKVPENCELLKTPLFWSGWKIDESSMIHYRITSIFKGFHLRAEIIEVDK